MSRIGACTPLWGESVPGLGGSATKEVFPYVEPKMVLQEFVTTGLCCPLEHSGEQMFSQILMYTSYILIGCHQVTPEPVLPQVVQSHSSQPLLIRPALLPSDHVCGSLLDSLKLLYIFSKVWSPELDAVIQLQPSPRLSKVGG